MKNKYIDVTNKVTLLSINRVKGYVSIKCYDCGKIAYIYTTGNSIKAKCLQCGKRYCFKTSINIYEVISK